MIRQLFKFWHSIEKEDQLNYQKDKSDWNTWDPRFAGCILHLPSQVALKVSTFSNRTGRYEDYSSSSKILFGKHKSDASFVEFDLEGDGSLVNVKIAKPDEKSFVVRTTVKSTSEWALRFWTLIEIGILPPTFMEGTNRSNLHKIFLNNSMEDQYGLTSQTIKSVWDEKAFSFVTFPRPVRCDLYDELDDLKNELDQRGYYFPHPSQNFGNWAALRFSAQEQPVVTTVMVESDVADDVKSKIDAYLKNADQILLQKSADASKGKRDTLAIRDVVAWNTMWDSQNSRYFTALSRGWVFDKFGGWGVWLNDLLFHALLAASVGDKSTALANLEVVMSGQQKNGILPCLLTAYTQWIDRSQPPIASYIVNRIDLKFGSTELMTKYFDQLLMAHDWWFENRDGNGDGLLEWGSSPVGDGTFVHSKQAAMDESAMDNLPVFDEASFDYKAHTLNQADVGLNSLLVLESEILTAHASSIGRLDVADRLIARCEDLKILINQKMWDETKLIYANLNWDGTFAKKHAPTSFYPLIAGIAEDWQIDALITQHLIPESRFGGNRPIPSTPRDDPSSEDNVYWRGRIWPPLAFLTWDGLHRVGRHSEAEKIANHLYSMFDNHFEIDRKCLENYHINDQHLDIAQDSDPFYTWGALIPLMKMLERVDSSPWEGVVVNPKIGHSEVLTSGVFEVAVETKNEEILFTSANRYSVNVSPVSRLTRLIFSDVSFGFMTPDLNGVSVSLKTIRDSAIKEVLIGGAVNEIISENYFVPPGTEIKINFR